MNKITQSGMRAIAAWRWLSMGAAVSGLALSACAPVPPVLPEPLLEPKPAAAAQQLPPRAELSTGIAATPTPPSAGKLSTGKPLSPAPAQPEEANITLTFDQLPLPTFIQTVYGTILKRNFTMDPQVASRNDLVTLRAAQAQTPSQLETAARLLLKSYGVAALELGGGFYRFTPDNAQTGYAPEIRRGRALPEVPLPLRPIFQLVELQAVRNVDVAGWIRVMFGNRITLNEDLNRNAVLLGGQSDDVMAALEAIHVLDQPLMKGRQSVRINPVFWSAEEFAKKLSDVLQAEGYVSGITPQPTTPVTVLPVQAINAIIVFAADPAIIGHVVQWAKELDKPSASRTGGGYFTYQVRNTDAQGLARTIQELLGGTPAAAPVGQAAVPAAKPPVTGGLSNRVVVNAATNTLIIQGNTEEYTRILNLLQELDRPARAALIEVTVAEVTLDDTTKLGVEWAFSAAGVSGATITGGTLGGIGLGPGRATTALGAGTQGLTIGRINNAGDLRLLLNALATSNRANVLSSPRLLARNGETATIQVGSEIPTITQQQTTPTTGGTGGILQSVQYRSTGVILKLKPVIHAGDRIDLEVSQEVSDSTRSGVANSPIVDLRKVDTKLSLRDGSTVLLGGIIQQNNSRDETGVPLLKDIPALGQLFRVDTDRAKRTELLVLITPYIVSDDHDAQAVTNAFRRQLGSWAHPRPSPSGTGQAPAQQPSSR